MGTCANFLRELGNKVDSGEQFGIPFRGAVKKHVGNKGYFGNFPKEHKSTDSPWGVSRVLCLHDQFNCLVFLCTVNDRITALYLQRRSPSSLRG